jgi:hypothetical protein
MSDLVFGPVTEPPAYATLLIRAASGVSVSSSGQTTPVAGDDPTQGRPQTEDPADGPVTTLSVLYQPPVYPDGQPVTLLAPDNLQSAALYTQAQSAYGAALSLTPFT